RDSDRNFQKHTNFSMNTYVTVTLPEGVPQKTIEQGFEKVDEMDSEISNLREQSRIPDKFYKLVKGSLELARDTEGFYDPTLYPVLKLWGFYGENPKVPSEEKLNSALEKTGYRKVNYENGNIDAPGYVRFDLGGYAKGWVVDSLVEYFKEKGINAGLVDAGGDIKAWGDKVWKIGIKNPRGEGINAILKIENMSVATSGDYENYFEENSKRYSHIINPDTGYPAQGIYSATVIAKSCAVADGFSTALLVAGLEKGEAWDDMFRGCVIIGDNKKYNTPDLDINWR
ncbi:MAG: FAD:protein FMN transferase, partial [Elusimicrobiota bacterium]